MGAISPANAPAASILNPEVGSKAAPYGHEMKTVNFLLENWELLRARRKYPKYGEPTELPLHLAAATYPERRQVVFARIPAYPPSQAPESQAISCKLK